MQVLCIDNSNPARPDMLLPEDWIRVGEVYTVIGTWRGPDGHLYYFLAEKVRDPKSPVYRSDRFVWLQDPQEPREQKTEDASIGVKQIIVNPDGNE